VTSTNLTWLGRASVAVAFVCAAALAWSWLPAQAGDGFVLIFMPTTLALAVAIPGILVSLRRLQPGEGRQASTMGAYLRWLLAAAPRWAQAFWALALGVAMLEIVRAMLAGRSHPADNVHTFTATALYFAVTAALIYRALAREQQA
jgi:hypothetical protein